MISQTKHVTICEEEPPEYIPPNNSHHEPNKNSPSHNTMYLTKTPPPSSTCFNQSHPSTPVLSMQSKDNSRCRVAATKLGCVPTANASSQTPIMRRLPHASLFQSFTARHNSALKRTKTSPKRNHPCCPGLSREFVRQTDMSSYAAIFVTIRTLTLFSAGF